MHLKKIAEVFGDVVIEEHRMLEHIKLQILEQIPMEVFQKHT